MSRRRKTSLGVELFRAGVRYAKTPAGKAVAGLALGVVGAAIDSRVGKFLGEVTTPPRSVDVETPALPVAPASASKPPERNMGWAKRVK